MSKNHSYQAKIVWTGNTGEGTKTYTSYSRAHEVSVAGKPVIPGSSDPVFRGDKSSYNPEEMLVASLSACHMLWYLHLCSDAGVIVINYSDEATGKMIETNDGGGHFTEIILRPKVEITDSSDRGTASDLHEKAHELCFIAASVNFPVSIEPTIVFAEKEENASAG